MGPGQRSGYRCGDDLCHSRPLHGYSEWNHAPDQNYGPPFYSSICLIGSDDPGDDHGGGTGEQSQGNRHAGSSQSKGCRKDQHGQPSHALPGLFLLGIGEQKKVLVAGQQPQAAPGSKSHYSVAGGEGRIGEVRPGLDLAALVDEGLYGECLPKADIPHALADDRCFRPDYQLCKSKSLTVQDLL